MIGNRYTQIGSEANRQRDPKTKVRIAKNKCKFIL